MRGFILTVESGSNHDCRKSRRIILTALDEGAPFPVSKWPGRRKKKHDHSLNKTRGIKVISVLYFTKNITILISALVKGG